MKEVIVSVILVFSLLCSANCQWYHKLCGVSDISNTTVDEFDCLWKKSNNLTKVGKTTCAVGTAFMIAGGITMIAADPCCSSGLLLGGYFTVLGGVAINIVGVPIWVVGAERKSKLKESIHYKNQAVKTIRITPGLQRNHHNNNYAFGITATFSF